MSGNHITIVNKNHSTFINASHSYSPVFVHDTTYLQGCLRLVEVADRRHHAQSLALRLLGLAPGISDTSSAPLLDVPPQQRQDLAVPPPSRNGPVCWLEGANGLGPLAGAGLAFPLVLDLYVLALRVGRRKSISTTLGCLVRGGCWLLRCPVVNVPIVLIQKQVILFEELGRHGSELGVGKRAHEEVTLECSPLAALICALLDAFNMYIKGTDIVIVHAWYSHPRLFVLLARS
jgi:hypothetical protein